MKSYILFSLLFVLLFINTNKSFGQFEKYALRQTTVELDTDLLQDTTYTYLRIMLCGDILYNQKIAKYTQRDNFYDLSYRTWFRQIKPLFYFSDIVIAGLRANFPGGESKMSSASAPDEFLAELGYTGFHALMMGNSQGISLNSLYNSRTLEKADKLGMYRAGLYYNSLDKKKNHPLILEKKDIRIALLSYTTDSNFLDFDHRQLNFLNIDSVKKDIERAKEIKVDYIIAYIDWGNIPDSSRLSMHIDLVNQGVDVVIGSGGNSFSGADVLDFSKGLKKIIVDDIGSLNADSNSRETNKSALIEVILKKNRKTNEVLMHDMGFIPIWTLIDPERYAVLPISNVEERHIQNINLNYLQYSNMKVALTDLRYTFFEKIQEIHYDYTDKQVNDVEHSSFIRKTLMLEQERTKEKLKEDALNSYVSTFGQLPPKEEETKRYIIPYDDIMNIYAQQKKKAIKWAKEIDRDMDTTDQTTAGGLLKIASNRHFYTRVKDTATPLTAEQKRVKDSIQRYRERFYVKDTIAELKAKLRRQKAEEKRVRDSIYYARISKPQMQTVSPIFEANPNTGKINPYKDVAKSGIFTPSDAPKEDNSPVKEIEEYFMIQIYSMVQSRGVDLEQYPFLRGYEVRLEEGNYRYYIGRTRSAQVAKEMCRQIRAKGIPEAFVVKYTDGIRSVYFK